MNKQQIISFIQGQLAAGKISKGDILDLANGNQVSYQPQSVPEAVVYETAPVKEESSSRNLINTFYGIGAIIAVVGVGILVAQHWDDIGFMGRLLVSLGISFVAYVAALLMNKPHQKMVSQVMFTISAALAPLGIAVLLNEAKVDFDYVAQIITASVMFVVYGTALFISRKNILVLLTIGFATWAYYAVVMKVFGFGYGSIEYLKWATMFIGASYVLIAYGHKSSSQATDLGDAKEKEAVQNVLYGLGTLAILGAGINVGGAFDLFFIAFIFAAFYGSVYLKSRSMLSLGAVFLMAHLIKLTSKYFVNSIGWPVALIVIGFLVIGVGYMTFYLNRKFISSK